MKAKFGSIVTDGRGKLGGHFFSRNIGGNFLGTKVSQNAKITNKYGRRNRFVIILAQYWRGLTDGQRAAWNNAVYDFMGTDVFGDLRKPSGFDLFKKLGYNTLEAGHGIQLLPPLPGCDYILDSLSIIASRGVDNITFNFTPELPEGYHILVYISTQKSPGKAFDVRSLKFLKDHGVVSSTSYNATSRYESYIGALPEIGSKIFGAMIPYESFTGVRGLRLVCDTIVTAGV